MIFSNLKPAQIAFLIIVPIVVIAVAITIFLLIYLPLRRRKMRTNFKYYYYKYVYKIAMDKDYYLINDFLFRIDKSHVARIDHILFGDKYIYILIDSYFDGDIDGKEDDTSIIRVERNGKKYYEDNPMLVSKKLVNKLSLVTGIDQSLMIGVCMINKDCSCGVVTTSKNFYIVQCSRFKQLVKAIESRPINPINQEQLASAVKAIDKLNRRRKKGEQK